MGKCYRVQSFAKRLALDNADATDYSPHSADGCARALSRRAAIPGHTTHPVHTPVSAVCVNTSYVRVIRASLFATLHTAIRENLTTVPNNSARPRRHTEQTPRTPPQAPNTDTSTNAPTPADTPDTSTKDPHDTGPNTTHRQRRTHLERHRPGPPSREPLRGDSRRAAN